MKTRRLLALFLSLLPLLAVAEEVDLSGASLLVSPSIRSPLRETVTRVLQEELYKRTALRTESATKWSRPVAIAVALSSDTALFGTPVPATAQKLTAKDGFTCHIESQGGKHTVWLIAADDRGALFAGGYLLRTARLSRHKILFDTRSAIATSPEYPIRGHQLGYRNTANSYDAWTPEQYEQYIRDLAIFGTNCIEAIPFETPSPLMKRSVPEMNRHISGICRQYGLDYWVWTPVTVDLADEKLFEEEVKKHSAYYRECPKLDDVFVPGGDPGDNHPKEVLPFLKAIAAELEKYHPGAGVWLSLQGFSDEQTDYFYLYLEQESPDWLRGVVSGPGSPPIPDTRYRLPKKYRHRHYPDITHTVRCQYPSPSWDQAYALTLGREPVNPEPFYYAQVYRRYAPFTDGFITYSDGAHDDVNKILWSRLGWDGAESVRHIAEQYVQFFFGTAPGLRVTDAIFALERNWRGAIAENGGIESAFAVWKRLEAACPSLQKNWRWQMLLLRAYYDTYTARRKAYEEGLEKEANAILQAAGAIGVEQAMQQALDKVNEADAYHPDSALRQKITAYCEALFLSVGLQTSVGKHGAKGAERGCVLDFVDYPLNNRWWLADQFDGIRRIPTVEEQLARLEVIRTWENPGKGSYYDNISHIAQSPHTRTVTDDACDVAWWDNGMSRKRLSTQLFQNFPRLTYEDLDPEGRYKIRISGFGEALLRVDGIRIAPVVYDRGLEEFKEFLIDRKYVSDGRLEVSFDEPEESRLNWRQYSKVCDVWLLKQEDTSIHSLNHTH
ncbi:MAG: hypothetical protein LBQ78_04645 [Tannerellaceae bacterium]|jgi:hypothetical protein|nr:hypothetical protein [Tannerellaceae bacterium]